jgi:hypothetical protein
MVYHRGYSLTYSRGQAVASSQLTDPAECLSCGICCYYLWLDWGFKNFPNLGLFCLVLLRLRVVDSRASEQCSTCHRAPSKLVIDNDIDACSGVDVGYHARHSGL